MIFLNVFSRAHHSFRRDAPFPVRGEFRALLNVLVDGLTPVLLLTLPGTLHGRIQNNIINEPCLPNVYGHGKDRSLCNLIYIL